MRRYLWLLVLVCVAACSPSTSTTQPTAAPTTPAVQIDLALKPRSPLVGDATLTVTISQAQAVDSAIVVQSDKGGLSPLPVNGTMAAGAIRAYLPIRWTEPGTFTLTVTITLADNTQVSKDLTVTVTAL